MTSVPHSPTLPYRINRIYLKSASVEVPRMAELPQQAEQPHIGVDMQTQANPAWPGALECVLRITLQGRLQGKSIFALEVSEAGVFELDGGSPDEVTRFVRQVAASVLFPFARKDLAMLAVSAGFQPILLDHIDFDALLTSVIEQHRASLRAQGPAPLVALHANRPAQATGEAIASAMASPEVPGPRVPESSSDQAQPGVTRETSPGLTASATPGAKHKTGSVRTVIIVLGLTLAAGLGGWYLQSWRDTPARPAPALATAPVPAPVASEQPPPPPPIPAVTQQALDASRQRLAEQPTDWFTIELGQLAAQAPLPETGALPLDRPLYLRQIDAATLGVLYGAFPTTEAAQAALAEARSRLSPDLLQGSAHVLRFGDL